MRRQRGVTLTGFLVASVIVIFILLLAFKLGPAYMEFHSIQKLLRTLAAESVKGGDFRAQARRDFSVRSSVDNITSINHNDIQITKDGERVVITAEYTVRVPLVYNISACMDFQATSEQR